MSKKYIVSRNGEHIGEDYQTREDAQREIYTQERNDLMLAERGWIKNPDKIKYWIIEKK